MSGLEHMADGPCTAGTSPGRHWGSGWDLASGLKAGKTSIQPVSDTKYSDSWSFDKE